MYNIQFYFDSAWTSADAIISDLVFNEVLHKDLKSADSSLKGRLVPSITLANNLRAMGREDIQARVLEDGVPIFTGYVSKSFQIEKAQKLEPISFEIVSPSNFLKRKITSNISYLGYSVSDSSNPATSIVHQLLILAGYTLAEIDADDILVTIPALVINSTDNVKYHDVLDTMLYEYGYVLGFDADGKFITRNLFSDSITTENVFNGANCLDQITQKKLRAEYDKVAITWTKVETLNDVPVFSESSGATDLLSCNVEVAADSYLFEDDEWYAEYGMDDYDLICATDVTLDLEKQDDLELLTFIPYSTQALLSIKNNNTVYSRYIYKLDMVAGTAIVRESTNISKVELADTDKEFTYEAQYIYDKTNGDAMASRLSSYYDYCDFTYELSSKTDYAVGSFVNVSDTGLGTILCRITERKKNLQTGKIAYVLEAVGEYSPTDTSYEKVYSYTSRTSTDIANKATKTDIINYGFKTLYCRSITVPETPTGSNPEGWYNQVPDGSTDPIYFITGNFDFDGNLVGSWAVPVRFTGASTIYGLLSNESHTIPTDENGENGNYTGADTTLHVYEGSVDTTNLWTIGYSASSGIIGTLSGSTFTVTEITQDSAYVDITADRSGMAQISKRFNVIRSRQGDQVPVYSLSVSSQIVKVYTDGTLSPSSLTFTATSSVGLSEVSTYEGIFKVYVDDILQSQSSTAQSEYTWTGFNLYPSETLFPSETLYPAYELTESTDDVKVARAELWSNDGTVLIDSQSIVFLKDVGFQLDDIIAASLAQVPSRVPKYLGKYFGALPSVYTYGDWFLIYDTNDSPYTRGVYLVNEDTSTTRIADDSMANANYIVAAYNDILWAVNNGYGDLNNYGSFTYIANLVSNSVFTNGIQIGTDQVDGLDDALTAKASTTDLNTAVGSLTDLLDEKADTSSLGSLASLSLVELAQLGSTVITGGYLETDLINVAVLGAKQALIDMITAQHMKVTGSLRGGDRYDSSGNTIDSTTSGFYIGSSGNMKVAGIQFEGYVGAGVQWSGASTIGSSTGISNSSSVTKIASMGGNRVAVLHSVALGTLYLSVFDWNGTSWTLVNTSLSPEQSATSLSAINTTDIVMSAPFSSYYYTLKTYRFTGSSWTVIGTNMVQLPISGVPAIAYLGSNRLIAIAEYAKTVYLCSYNPSTYAWTIEEPTYTFSIALSNVSVAVMDGSTFVLKSNTNLNTLSVGGSSITLLDTSTISGVGAGQLTALNSSDIILADSGYNALRMYHYNGSGWEKSTSFKDYSMTINSGGVASFNGTDFAYVSSNTQAIQTYRVAFALSVPYTSTIL